MPEVVREFKPEIDRYPIVTSRARTSSCCSRRRPPARCAFEVGAMDLGMGVTYLDRAAPDGQKESIEDTAHVLDRFYDGIEFRGFAQSDGRAGCRRCRAGGTA
ncbi:MAG: hypothetical protein ACLSVD_01920 [Eggerthellaceae bacterium]